MRLLFMLVLILQLLLHLKIPLTATGGALHWRNQSLMPSSALLTSLLQVELTPYQKGHCWMTLSEFAQLCNDCTGSHDWCTLSHVPIPPSIMRCYGGALTTISPEGQEIDTDRDTDLGPGVGEKKKRIAGGHNIQIQVGDLKFNFEIGK